MSDELYDIFHTPHPPLDHKLLPTVDQIKTAYRKQKLAPCTKKFYDPSDPQCLCACPLAVLAFARGVARGPDCGEAVATYWRSRIGYWNAAWLFHGIDDVPGSLDIVTDEATPDQLACLKLGWQIRREIGFRMKP